VRSKDLRGLPRSIREPAEVAGFERAAESVEGRHAAILRVAYYSLTIPAVIVATYGGGTGLATQRECLEMLGCYGKDKVRKLAEIVAATVLCGELSLGSAVVAEEWVEAHDSFGRNR
jgi:hydroxymethylglutaryl-CoA reductase